MENMFFLLLLYMFQLRSCSFKTSCMWCSHLKQCEGMYKFFFFIAPAFMTLDCGEHRHSSNNMSWKTQSWVVQALPRAITHGRKRCRAGRCTGAEQKAEPWLLTSRDLVCSWHSVIWVICQEYE